ncbi:unnamed protein product [Prorocentrum cordatum]|uniref:Uncharacterized protein n=1 Tax=Prorocentrum cordatum TaxID=2364126 RepID=A0ABN9W3G7_9DINO|nr:unnamed protein product [Polarella glacialis]
MEEEKEGEGGGRTKEGGGEKPHVWISCSTGPLAGRRRVWASERRLLQQVFVAGAGERAPHQGQAGGREAVHPRGRRMGRTNGALRRARDNVQHCTHGLGGKGGGVQLKSAGPWRRSTRTTGGAVNASGRRTATAI